MREQNSVIAILTADWHLRHKPPVFRSAEPDWYAAMERPICEIRVLSEKYKCPVLFAGDIFEKWYGAPGKDCPTLINWCSRVLRFPQGLYCIAGQHDLPEHSWTEFHRSAINILLNLYTIKGMSKVGLGNTCSVQGFLYGSPLTSCDCKCDKLHIAIAHQYRWVAGKSYEGASLDDKIPRKKKGKWLGYDVVVFGDNHKGFITKVGKTVVCNCGAITINKSDEIDYKPRVGLLYSDGHVEPHYLDISKDKYLPLEKAKKMERDEEEEENKMKEFAEMLATLGNSALDFTYAWEKYVKKNKLKDNINRTVLRAMNNGFD